MTSNRIVRQIGGAGILFAAAACTQALKLSPDDSRVVLANQGISAANPGLPGTLIGGLSLGVVNKLLERCDHVIIDSPPVLGLADAPLIAAAVEGTIYAVEARAIRTSRVRTAMNRLRSANINLLGVVLTKFSSKHSHYSYAYDYRYGYGKSTQQA